MRTYLLSILNVVCEMAPFLLLGFLIAGVLHVFVPQGFYRKYLSKDNKLAVLWSALLGVPLPLCSCGVIPTAIGLRNEKASKGAVASFLIATPQTGIDSILATFSLMGLARAQVCLLQDDTGHRRSFGHRPAAGGSHPGGHPGRVLPALR